MDTAKQMQMAFMEEGGLTDDGTSVDPVSGNEVPPGSMAEEVRDDVPAQLSEGEYVVPADVVRFYGVKFFEDLRGEAKRGLMNMEANGRIGGEPVAQTIDNQTGGELTPEELAAVAQITGMAMGGVVQPSNPYLQQQQMYQQPAPIAMGNTAGYRQGGQVLYAAPGTDVSTGTGITNPITGKESDIDPYTAQFTQQDAGMFAPGFSIEQALSNSPITAIIMYGPNGEVETVTLPAQQARYDELIEMGYSETPVETTTETKVGMTEEDAGGLADAGQQGPVGKDLGNMSLDALNDALQGLENNTSFESKALDFMDNTIVGKAIAAITGKSMKDKAKEDYEAEIASRGAKAKSKDTQGKSKGQSTDSTPSDATPSEDAPFSGTPMGPTPAQEAQAALEAQISIDAFGGDTAPTGDPDAPSPDAPSPDAPSPSGNASPDPSVAGAEVGSGKGGTDATGPFNQGGMVQRRTKKKK